MPPLTFTLSASLRLAARLLPVCLICLSLAIAAGRVIQAQHIAFTMTYIPNTSVRQNRLHLADARTGLVMKVSDQPVLCCMIWSPDGNRVAFSSPPPPNDQRAVLTIWNLRQYGSYRLELPGAAASGADWSPDSQWLLITLYQSGRGYDLYKINVTDGSLKRLTFLSDMLPRVTIYDVDWSPDGEFIVFAAGNGDGTAHAVWEIYRIEADGSNLRPLTHFGGNSMSPRVSPDGSRIAFRSELDGNMELFIMGADGSNPQRLTYSEGNEGTPYWSPDGRQLLVQTFINQDYPRVLDIMNADGSERRRLADQTSFNNAPAWSPDGSQVLYEVQHGSGSALYVVDADGGHARLLAEDALAANLHSAWQPRG